MNLGQYNTRHVIKHVTLKSNTNVSKNWLYLTYAEERELSHQKLIFGFSLNPIV